MPQPLSKPTTMRAAFAGAAASVSSAVAERPPRRWRLWLLATLVVALACGTAGVLAMRHGFILVITQADIQAQAERTFPVTEDFDGLLEITYRDPVISLKTGHAEMRATFVGGVMEHDLVRGQVALTAIPRYVPETGELYLDRATLDGISMEHGPNRLLERYRVRISSALAYWLAHHPVYTLTYATLRKAAARTVVRSLAIDGDAIRIDLGW